MKKAIRVGFPGMDQIELSVDIQGDLVKVESSHVVGSLALLKKFQQLLPQLSTTLAKLNVPSGKTCEDLLLKELVLRLKGQWVLENDAPELCHCRKIPQSSVERAIVLGAHTVEQIRARTSANTGCGTCLPDVERVLGAYL